MSTLSRLISLPTFVFCKDKKYYENLVYQDFPERRDWFICFDDKEPAEIVMRESAWNGGISPKDILKHRRFDECVVRIINGRKDPHLRFFGGSAGEGVPLEGHSAISWFLVFKKGVLLPAPNQHDICDEIWPMYPNREGIYFGL